MRILIIDDDPQIRQIVKVVLAHAGISVLEAATGGDGVALADRERPDAILLDVQLPDMDGPATRAALLATPSTAAIPVIFLTGTSTAEARERLASLGVRGVLSKPFAPASLSADVRALLGAPPPGSDRPR
jgi:two-component system, OmpR family, alkaline phosphatase synthesis response regulator PhoP